MKIRLWGTGDECKRMAQLLIDAPGFEVVSVSEPYADRGASVLVRVFIEARLDQPPAAHHVPATPSAARDGRRRTLPPGGEHREDAHPAGEATVAAGRKPHPLRSAR
jgi:hypothetical protein